MSETPERQLGIQRIYIKDVSFEAPHAPAIFQQQWEPKVEFTLGTQAQQLQEGLFEVTLAVSVSAKVGEHTAYLVEITQGGVFQIAGFSDQEMGPLLGSYCPNLLYPYAREAVSDLVAKGGYPQMLLAPLNFDALYAEHLQRSRGEGAPTTAHTMN